jgi:predicted DCC family thiol-disulfide oxidoreductase YuxK
MAKELNAILEKYPILFYDGDCGFCSNSVQFVLKHGKSLIYFMPLQSPKAIEIIEQSGFQGSEKISMNTMYFLEKGKILKESRAVLTVCKYLKFPYPVLFYLGIIVPPFIRNTVYRAIAKRRFSLANPSCLLPSLEERERFIL